MTHWLIITDLDGTLLDADTYSPAVAQPTLARIQQAGVPIIFCSAKTYAEQRPIRAALNVTDPCIVENGSAIVWTEAERMVFGVPAATIHVHLREIMQATGLALQTFQDVTAERVAEITGLDVKAAERAQQRDYSATVFTQLAGADLERFQAACDERQLKAPSGGRFLTVTGKGADKGVAVRRLVGRYQAQGTLTTIGIGDSPNDAPLLLAVDEPYQVQRPDGTWKPLPITIPNLHRVEAIGPAAWAKVMEGLLARLGSA